MEVENPLERDHTLAVVLPGGLEKTTTVHGSKPVMDLLVTLCARHHLNPSDHTVELLSANSNNISFKPNSPIGALEAERVFLKPKGHEEKIRRPYMPEATVRLLINYRRSHKAVVRVNPRVPLEKLLPAVCEKCEFDPETTLLLRDAHSQEPLDLTKTLHDVGLRELYAKDTAAVSPTPTDVAPSPPPPPPPPQQECVKDSRLPKKEKKQKEKENKGLFSLFRRNKKKSEKGVSVSAPGSPGLNNQRVASMNSLVVHTSNTLPSVMPKKRRAPQPPMAASHSLPADLSTRHLGFRPPGSPEGEQSSTLSRVSSTESSLKRTKRRAPPPPCANSLPGPPQDKEVKGTVMSLYILKEMRETGEMDSPPPGHPNPLGVDNNLCLSATPPVAGVVAPSPPSLAQTLTSSLVSGALLKPLKNRNGATKSSNGSFVSSTQPYPHYGNSLSTRSSSMRLEAKPASEKGLGKSPTQREGMTTFTVVPRSSLLKQRTFEVELTLMVSDQARGGAKDSSAVAAAEVMNCHSKTREILESPKKPEAERTTLETESKLCPTEISKEVTNCVFCPPALPGPVDFGEISPHPATDVQEVLELPANEDQPASPTAKVNNLPPDLLVHYNGIPGDDATSTSEQGSSGSIISLAEVLLNTGTAHHDTVEAQEDEEESFPPPPPPVCYDEVVEEGEERPFSSKDPSSLPTSPRLTQSNPLPRGPPPEGFYGKHLAQLTSPRPYVPTNASKPLVRIGTIPSRFAQAVAQAVQKSQTGIRGTGPLPQPTPCSPHPSALPLTNMVPEWLPHKSQNGSSCLG